MIHMVHAGIETLVTTAVVSFITAAGVSAAAAAVIAPVLTAALVIGGGLLATQLLGRHAGFDTGGTSAIVDPGAAKSTFENEDSPEIRAVGLVRLGGLKAFGNASGSNKFRLIFHAKGEFDGFEEYYLGGREVVIDSNGAVTSFPWDRGSGSSWAYLKSKTGTEDETSWSDLQSYFSTWTSAHRARGVAQTLCRYVSPGFSDPNFLKLYQNGAPDLEIVARAEKDIYDPRIDSEAWTQNGILNALHILLTFPEISLSDIDTNFISDEADRADVLVSTLAGDVLRSTCNGVWSSESNRGETMQTVLDSIGAWIIQRDNGLKIGIQLIDDIQTAELTIALEDIVDITWNAGPQAVERPNICRVKYYSPELNYSMAEIGLQTVDDSGNYTGPPWARVQQEIDAHGPQYFDVNLPFCTNAGLAQRRARQMFALKRSDIGTIITNMAGINASGAQIVSFEQPDDLDPITAFIGTPRINDQDGTVEIPFVSWPDLSEWDPETDEVAAPTDIPDPSFGNPLTTPDVPSATTVVTYPVGGTFTRVAYTIPVDATQVEATIRTYVDDKPTIWSGMTEYVGLSGFAHAYIAIDETGVDCDFRFRTSDGDENGSAWSPIFNATPAVDNSAPDPCIFYITPTLPGLPTFAVTVRAPDSLNVSYLTVSGTGAPTINAIRPGEQSSWVVSPADIGGNDSSDYAFSALAKASDGTASALTSANIEQDSETGGYICLCYGGGSDLITVGWKTPADAGVVTMKFTGSNAPGDTAVIPFDYGTWTVSGLSSGTYTFTARGYDVSDIPIGDVASVSVTI